MRPRRAPKWLRSRPGLTARFHAGIVESDHRWPRWGQTSGGELAILPIRDFRRVMGLHVRYTQDNHVTKEGSWNRNSRKRLNRRISCFRRRCSSPKASMPFFRSTGRETDELNSSLPPDGRAVSSGRTGKRGVGAVRSRYRLSSGSRIVVVTKRASESTSARS